MVNSVNDAINVTIRAHSYPEEIRRSLEEMVLNGDFSHITRQEGAREYLFELTKEDIKKQLTQKEKNVTDEKKFDSGFDEYMRQQIPNYRENINSAVLTELEDLYKKANEWNNISQQILTSAFKSKSGIDYSTDLEKASNNAIMYKQNFQATIDEIKRVVHPDSDLQEENTVNRTR